ncbi:disease resistance protein SUMM2-like [Gossypium arboreum]|uniref:disease resistance protein SUMM2-like n=1 Tax=Gossypium arboreum TaxID=29729 RepID=UPI0022F19091|nr:disease resistance protein SUMM2-like [Gossypium arboreum]
MDQVAATLGSALMQVSLVSCWSHVALQTNAQQKELSEHKQSVNELENEVLQQLRFSHDRLNDLKLRHCFLSCALYPEDWRIEERELVKLWIAEGLVEEMNSRQAEFDKGRAIINRLKNNCLLEDFSELEKKYLLISNTAYNKRGVKMHGHMRYMACNKGRVKMHDLTRDMALHITSAKPRFLVKAGMGLREPPNVQEWSEDLEKVSLMRNRMLEVLYPLEMSPPKYPMLTTLSLADCGIKGIPEDGVPFLSKLRDLKELDLQGTKIKEVPHGLEKLVESQEVGELKKLEMIKGRFYDFHDLSMYLQAFHDREVPRKYIILVGKRQFPELVLECLPELKSICSFDAVVDYESLKWINVRDCRKLKRLPFSLPQIRSSSPLSFSIYVTPEEWWKSVEWDYYHAQSLLEPFVTFLSI